MKLLDNDRGGYRFLTGIAPYSSGVVAMDGYEVVHVTLRTPIAYRRGFEVIERHLADHGRPRHALCAVALRSPKPLSLEGFAEFNRDYLAILAEWDLLVEGHNPLARTNVAPALHAPEEASLYSFAYTVAGDVPAPTFVVAGAADVVTQALTERAIVREGETTAEAMTEKAAHVMRTMGQRVDGLQVTWSDVTRVNVYTVHAVRAYLCEVILAPLAETSVHGVHWHYARPPIVGLEFEMDLRGVRCERWLDR
jgi:hypothetical protein